MNILVATRPDRRPPLCLRALAALPLAWALASCQQAPAPAAAPEAAAPSPSTPSAAPPATEAATPLQGMLDVLAAPVPPQWSSFDAVPGTQWPSAQVEHNPEVRDRLAQYTRWGKLRLAGMGEVDLPNGKLGVEAGVVKGNEGDVAINLFGDQQRPYSFTLVKHYPRADYRPVIQAQLAQGGQVQPYAEACQYQDGPAQAERQPNQDSNAFFRIVLADGRTLYAEGSLDEEGGKYDYGHTYYAFYRQPPDERIQAMGCKRADGAGAAG